MRKILLSLLIIGATVSTSFSQTNKSCDPKACGPNNTKVGEAKVITKLRGEVSEVKTLIGAAKIEMKEAAISHSALKHLPLDIENNSEDATLLILYMDVACMRQTLNLAAGSPNYSSKAQLVASMRSDLSAMKNQLASN
ncbi:hypothetical protein SAMN04488029_2240 [Reichenbachiella faecimaris]|uniref:DUF4142 domain-containing protein n=1 Tax=Reichenbachiella faecimaris TaxID=692418 RepID=A0A1W2GF59_REIFA|nr:hypothetical protein [Reichenbachiella faecimaris]SMD34896.1 hypothetical protein SAMN04488029_2240 [Reichenbachiella faecimaris]